MKKIIKALAFTLFIGALFVNSKSLTRFDNSSSLNLSNLELIQVASAETAEGSIIIRIEIDYIPVYMIDEDTGELELDHMIKETQDFRRNVDANGNFSSQEYSNVSDINTEVI